MENTVNFSFKEEFLWKGKPELKILINQWLILYFVETLLLFIPIISLNLIQFITHITFNYYFIYPYIGFVMLFPLYFLKRRDIYLKYNYRITNEMIFAEGPNNKELLLTKIKKVRVKKSLWDIKEIDSGSIIINRKRDKKEAMELKHIKNVNEVLALLKELLPSNPPVELKSSAVITDKVRFERVSIKNCEVLWQGTKSLNSIEGILALKFIILFESILIPLLLIITISTYNVLADERGFTIGILIFLACCYFMICAFNVRAVKTANRTDYIITDKEVIRIVKNRFKDQIPLDNIRGFQIKKTNLAFPGLNIGTIFFYDKIHKRPEMTFNDIDDLHEVKAILEQKIKFRLKISDDDKVSYFVQPKQA